MVPLRCMPQPHHLRNRPQKEEEKDDHKIEAASDVRTHECSTKNQWETTVT